MNQNSKSTNPNNFQLRLLIPREWVEELNILAKAKFRSRLALLRQYIRTEIDLDFTELNEFHNNRHNLRQAKAKTEQWIKDLEEKKKGDQW